MTLDFNFVALFDLLAFVQGTLLGILLMLKKKEHLSYFLLGLFTFSYSSELIVSVFIDSNIFSHRPDLLYLPVSFYFLFMPCLFLYVKNLTESIIWKKYWWIFLPAAGELIMNLYLFFQSTETKLLQLTNGDMPFFFTTYILVAMVYSVIYAVFILKLIRDHNRRVKNFYSNVKGKLLNWVHWICIFIIIINLSFLSISVFSSEFYEELIYPIVSLANVVFIFWVALSGFRQKTVIFPSEEIHSQTTKVDNDKIIKPKDSEPSSTNSLSNLEFQKLKDFIIEKKLFAEPELHLAELAKQLHISQRKLSEIINQEAGINFNQFINQFRVAEAKRLLVDKKYAHLNILGIAYEVGFNSKTTFYAAFKNELGITPSKYQKQHQNKTSEIK